jgi:argininosuccinate synthase
LRGAKHELKKVIVAYVGSVDELAAIRQLAARPDVEVVAVALDLGDGVELRELHDEARAAGAVRCHTLDVRDEFMREYVLPELQALTGATETITALAHRLIARKLAEVAEIEGAAEVMAISHHTGIPTPPSNVPPSLGGTSPSFGGQVRVAQVDIAFEAGVPVAINGIPMTLTELIESLSTIAAAHGIGGARPGLAILQAAHRDLAGGPDPVTGSAHIELFKGQMKSCQPEYATA